MGAAGVGRRSSEAHAQPDGGQADADAQRQGPGEAADEAPAPAGHVANRETSIEDGSLAGVLESRMTVEVQQWLTFGIAVLGAALGVLNTWRALGQDRVRLVVRAGRPVDIAGGPCLLIEVRNLSSFAVTITHIGFDRLGADRHFQLVAPRFLGGQSLPARMEPRTALTVVQPFAAFEDEEQLLTLRNVYVLTACGVKRKSSDLALTVINHLAGAHQK